jgi:hypothetical protein
MKVVGPVLIFPKIIHPSHLHQHIPSYGQFGETYQTCKTLQEGFWKVRLPRTFLLFLVCKVRLRRTNLALGEHISPRGPLGVVLRRCAYFVNPF